jgi:hypothetical protein
MALATLTARTAVWALGLPDTIRQHKSTALYLKVGFCGGVSVSNVCCCMKNKSVFFGGGGRP